jgi:hypothetical protein
MHMPGTTIGDDIEVGRASIVEQAKSVLAAGGTVYIGEDHTAGDSREICELILTARCVQYFCIEFFETFHTGDLKSTGKDIDKHESTLGHKSPVKMSILIDACEIAGTEVVFAEKNLLPRGRKNPDGERQKFTAQTVKACRNKLNKADRGVLVLIGGDHLITRPGTIPKTTVWESLQSIVYGGLTFTHGRYRGTIMMWQLS